MAKTEKSLIDKAITYTSYGVLPLSFLAGIYGGSSDKVVDYFRTALGGGGLEEKKSSGLKKYLIPASILAGAVLVGHNYDALERMFRHTPSLEMLRERAGLEVLPYYGEGLAKKKAIEANLDLLLNPRMRYA